MGRTPQEKNDARVKKVLDLVIKSGLDFNKLGEGVYHDTGLTSGGTYSQLTQEGVEAYRQLLNELGVSGRIGDLEKMVSQKGNELRGTQRDLDIARKQMDSQWNERYNGKGFTKVGAVQLDEEGQVSRMNERIRAYFGEIQGVDLSGLIERGTREKQEFDIGGNTYIAVVVNKGPIGTDVKIYQKGVFSELKAKREEDEAEADRRHKEILEAANQAIEKFKEEYLKDPDS